MLYLSFKIIGEIMQVKLPKIDKIPDFEIFNNCFKPVIINASKIVIKELKDSKKLENLTKEEVLDLIKKYYDDFMCFEPKPLINATGVVIHTNLGRSPLNLKLMQKVLPIICAYSNLEYNLDKGERGDRYAFSSKILNLLCGSEDALIVNNNAAAVFLILNTFAKNSEVIVSRGELVEIGGSFRIPEVMSNSGAILKEVGTTNKTHFKDYQNAINDNTAMILKIHKSNYDIVGFSKEIGIDEISNLAEDREIISYYDLGSTFINELPNGLSQKEMNLSKLISSGVGLLSFSGDKLFGSVQCGVILGKKGLIKQIKQNQLLRMLRVDKITLSILNETIKAYLDKNYELISILNQIYKPLNKLENLAKKVKDNIKFKSDIINSTTFIGGGTMPNKNYPTIALAISGDANLNEKKFRKAGIIGRIENKKFLLDFRSILEEQIPNLINSINGI